MKTIVLDGSSLTLRDIECIAKEGTPISVSEDAMQRVRDSKAVVNKLADSDQPVYGISTGFGELSRVKVGHEENGALQRNLILSHACAVGKPLSKAEVRAMMLLRLNTLLKGISGVSPEAVVILEQFLNLDLWPRVPEKGSLGASGDLANLAHMALAMIGEGYLADGDGDFEPTADVLKRHNLEPVVLSGKDGLAIINGTPVMGSLGVLAWRDAEALWHYANMACALTFEAFHGITKALDHRVHEARPHRGQILAAKALRNYLEGSTYVDTREGDVQDPYTLRCTPQVHGASYDAIQYVGGVLETEINAVTDNPLVFPEDDDVISGGNFHGQPLALALDFLAIAVAELANISERRIERMVNPQLSGGLPAFLVAHEGVNSGFMIPQYTAACLVSENKVLTHPASVDSIPSSANKEDHVSMGANAARKLRDVIWNTRQVLAIEMMTACQAIDLADKATLGKGTQKIYDAVRNEVSFLDKDRIMQPDMEKLAQLLADRDLKQKLEEVLPETADANLS